MPDRILSSFPPATPVFIYTLAPQKQRNSYGNQTFVADLQQCKWEFPWQPLNGQTQYDSGIQTATENA